MNEKKKLKSIDLLYASPFLCTCVKELWLLVQIVVEQLHERDALRTFWFYFNAALMETKQNDSTRSPTKSEGSSPLKWSAEFPIWLLCGVAKLHGFSVQGQFHGPANDRVITNLI